MQSGLNKVKPDRRDYSLLHTYGATTFDTQSLPVNFSIYDGRPIPNQNIYDYRFNPPVRPLPYGCTGESQTFVGGLEDKAMYRPDDLYDNTYPYKDGEGRDLRTSLATTISRGYESEDGTIGNKRVAYFTCYGAGAIDDFDAVRIALWINQQEKRPVTVGSFWYKEFHNPINGSLQLPSFDTSKATLHNYIVTGWRTIKGVEELEVISWQGMDYGLSGLCYMSRAIFNALLSQPYSAAFTLTKVGSNTPVPIGFQAILDHFVYFIRNLLHV